MFLEFVNYDLNRPSWIEYEERNQINHTVFIRFSGPGRLPKSEVLRGALNRGGVLI